MSLRISSCISGVEAIVDDGACAEQFVHPGDANDDHLLMNWSFMRHDPYHVIPNIGVVCVVELFSAPVAPRRFRVRPYRRVSEVGIGSVLDAYRSQSGLSRLPLWCP